MTGDEELGSPGSRPLIEAEARGCAAVLVLEAAVPGGALKTGCKGVSLCDVHVGGRAAHAGLEPEAGVNAAVELASQVLVVTRLADPDRGTSETPTVLAAASSRNTVPARGHVAVDVRVPDRQEQGRVHAAMGALRPTLPGARVQASAGPKRAPLEPAMSERLYARALAVADRLGLPPPGAASVGGGSDGNLTAGLGVPTLDGRAVGAGAHADDEHVLVGELPTGAALAADLLGSAGRG